MNVRLVRLKGFDVSQGGIGLSGPSMTYVGATGLILLIDRRNRATLRGIRVVSCEYVGKSVYRIGAEWVAAPKLVPVRVRETPHGFEMELIR